MRKGQAIRALSELRDLEIFDSAGELCGIADDLEFEGGPGEALRLSALLVGPGAYRGRMPGWLLWIVQRLAGDGIVRVPYEAIVHVTSRVTLDRRAAELGLGAVDRRLARFIPKIPAL